VRSRLLLQTPQPSIGRVGDLRKGSWHTERNTDICVFSFIEVTRPISLYSPVFDHTLTPSITDGANSEGSPRLERGPTTFQSRSRTRGGRDGVLQPID
jgi:hypothetical protein